MASGINEGFANRIAVAAESAFGGSQSGPSYACAGKISFSYQPRLESGLPKINVWRFQDGDSFAARYFTGSVEMEYSHSELAALLLSSILKRSGTTPHYTFGPGHLSDRRSLAIGLSYVPNNLEFVFRGVIVESVTFTVQARQLFRCRFDFKAAKMTTDGPLTSLTDVTPSPLPGLVGEFDYGGSIAPQSYDGSVQMVRRIDMVNFGEDGTPTDYEQSGALSISGEMAEWMPDDATGGDRIAANVRNQTEAAFAFKMTPGIGKLFQVSIPRSLTRSGTPPGLQVAGIGYRASAESQMSEAMTDAVSVTMDL